MLPRASAGFVARSLARVSDELAKSPANAHRSNRHDPSNKARTRPRARTRRRMRRCAPVGQSTDGCRASRHTAPAKSSRARRGPRSRWQTDLQRGGPRLHLDRSKRTSNTIATIKPTHRALRSIELPKTYTIVRFWASKQSFVTMFTHWEEASWRVASTIPDEYTVWLERGVTAGGRIVDENDRPIAGAKVQVKRGERSRSRSGWFSDGLQYLVGRSR